MSIIKVAPSILSADFSKMGEEIKKIENATADLIHCDVMDGMFVPNITFGSKMIADIKKHTKLELDAHLMVVKPERYVDDFIKAGSNYITIHVEATDAKTIKNTLAHIKKSGVKCGVVVNPETSIEKAYDFVAQSDMVLIMSVHPGFGGQKYIESVSPKITLLKKFITQNNLATDIEIDGGITLENVSNVIELGANVIVAGSTIFSSDNFEKTIRQLRGE